jgi:uncharacterized protein
MPNRLANETSPYLQQHADNPVEWFPWGEEALEKARREEKPILLSIGYAACHWCHVMAHESFEDPATAEMMNRHFVNVKVDREERPDLDSIYMNAVVALTGQGGWPMTVFLTPEGQPFYGGTYFPREPRFGMPGFKQVLRSVADAWEKRRDDIVADAEKVGQHLEQRLTLTGEGRAFGTELFDTALPRINEAFEARKGGFGDAPKFPPSMTLEFLLRVYHEREDSHALYMVEHTLEQMAHGGIYDQIGGGFARYSTDRDWLVPHFEKMLYDNALLSRVYLHAWQVTGKPLYRRIAEETLDWVVREMRHEDGGFYSSLDADSEGEEGKFYVWRPDEVRAVLEDEVTAALFMGTYDVTETGNWEGTSILNVRRAPEEVAAEMGLDADEAAARLAKARQALYDARAERVWPGLDDKVLTAWNGLMLRAFAEAGRVLQREDYTQVAVDNARFLYETMRTENGRLLRTWKDGHEAHYNGYLEDYAYLAAGLLELYQTVFDEQWFVWARELAEMMLAHFRDEEHGGFYDTSDDHEALIQRPKDVQDNAIPSGNAVAALVLLQLSLYTGEERYGTVAETMIGAMVPYMARYPTGFAHWLCDAALLLGEPQEIAVVGQPGSEETETLLAAVFAGYRPHQVVAAGDGEETAVPLLQARTVLDGRATAYVCRNFVCQLPVNTPEALAAQIEGA